MGCVPLTLETVQRHIARVGGFGGCRMMELGCQQMYCHRNIPEGSAAKSWFTRLGCQHTSIDMNGELGALQLNLADPIEKPEWDNQFDVVTDFGTTEHVGPSLTALYNCRANCHRWCRPGGLMFFNNPKTGHWPHHGYHFFTLEHYQKLASACNYGIVDLWEHPTLGNHIDGYQTFAVLVKQDATPFIPEQQFVELCQGTVFKS
jgi:Methyltransferase domain